MKLFFYSNILNFKKKDLSFYMYKNIPLLNTTQKSFSHHCIKFHCVDFKALDRRLDLKINNLYLIVFLKYFLGKDD